MKKLLACMATLFLLLSVPLGVLAGNDAPSATVCEGSCTLSTQPVTGIQGYAWFEEFLHGNDLDVLAVEDGTDNDYHFTLYITANGIDYRTIDINGAVSDYIPAAIEDTVYLSDLDFIHERFYVTGSYQTYEMGSGNDMVYRTYAFMLYTTDGQTVTFCHLPSLEIFPQTDSTDSITGRSVQLECFGGSYIITNTDTYMEKNEADSSYSCCYYVSTNLRDWVKETVSYTPVEAFSDILDLYLSFRYTDGFNLFLWNVSLMHEDERVGDMASVLLDEDLSVSYITDRTCATMISPGHLQQGWYFYHIQQYWTSQNGEDMGVVQRYCRPDVADVFLIGYSPLSTSEIYQLGSIPLPERYNFWYVESGPMMVSFFCYDDNADTNSLQIVGKGRETKSYTTEIEVEKINSILWYPDQAVTALLYDDDQILITEDGFARYTVCDIGFPVLSTAQFEDGRVLLIGEAESALLFGGDTPYLEDELPPSAPQLSESTGNSITVKPAAGFEYSIDGENWQASNVFTGLMPKTEYHIIRRFAATAENTAGPCSDALTVQTAEGCPFTDVIAGEWYFDNVMYAYKNRIFVGVDATHFEPNTAMTRSMMVQALYKMSDEASLSAEDFAAFLSEAGYENPYLDVPQNEWFAKAVAWATVRGVVSGDGSGRFLPLVKLDRQQLATMMKNYAAANDRDTSGRADLSAFTDAGDIAAWARDAFEWAYHEQLLYGTGNNCISPAMSASRAQACAIIERYIRTQP